MFNTWLTDLLRVQQAIGREFYVPYENINEVINRFYPQIIEELYELEESQSRGKRSHLEELADVFIYLVQLYADLYRHHPNQTGSIPFYPSTIVTLTLEETIGKVVLKLGKIRRMVSNRKYHKSKYEATEYDTEFNWESLDNLISHALSALVCYARGKNCEGKDFIEIVNKRVAKTVLHIETSRQRAIDRHLHDFIMKYDK